MTGKNKKIAVVGLGYVGLPLAVEFARKGAKTYGVDVDSKKVEAINRGENYIEDVNSELLKNSVDNDLLSASTDFAVCADCDAIFICVPTPFSDNKDPDISYIISAAEEISKYLKKNHVVILKSTTFPGTTRNYVRPILEKSGLIAGEDFHLAFSPERIDPGNNKWHTGNTPIVVGGINDESSEIARQFHSIVVDNVVSVKTPEIAELEKLLENIFRSVNIALVNELAQLCDRIGVNVWDVVDAAATKPFGYMPFYPGPGIGGHCILIDPYYLAWMARKYDFVTNFITLAAEINEEMPFYVRSMIIREIAKQPVAYKDARVLVFGMAFKRDVDDLRHSPALKVMELLFEDGAENVEYYDPHIPEININGKIFKTLENISPEILARYDVGVITTDHSCFDYDMIGDHCKAIIDSRNAMKNYSGSRKHISLLGDGESKNFK